MRSSSIFVILIFVVMAAFAFGAREVIFAFVGRVLSVSRA